MERFRSDEDTTLSRVPVFVFPSTIYFNAKERDNLKQILTIYNPYEFPIRFKVLSNSPSVYTVIDPEGSIKSKNCVDLILKVCQLPGETSGETHVEHKFRVQVYHFSDRKLIGRRDVSSLIHWGNLPQHLVAGGEAAAVSESFQQCPPGAAAPRREQQQPVGGGGVGVFLPAGHQPNYVILITAVMCVIGLMLPISGESCVRESATSSQSISSIIPPYLHLTINQKMLAAYALGLVTMVILRP